MTPEIYLGPPGTGKTTTLLNILDQELTSGTRSDSIGFFSFTTKASNEAAERAATRFKLDRKTQLPYFRTLHSLCYRVLGLRGSDVLAGKKFQEFADWAGIRVTGRAWSDDGMLSAFESGDRILFMENMARIREVPLRQQFDQNSDDQNWTEVSRVARALAEFKASHGLLDYTDMLSEFVRSGVQVKLDVLFGDEMQDFSSLQWRVFEKLANGVRRVCVAGDDDQAIFRWAGADVEHIIDMPGSTTVLGQSFRCPPAVQLLSNEIISPIAHRRSKKWKARKGESGGLRRVAEFGDSDIGEEGTVLVLARNSKFLQRHVEASLRSQGVVYELGTRSSLDMGGLRAAITWTHLTKDRTVTLGDARQMYEYLPANTGVKRGFKKLANFGENDEMQVTAEELGRDGGLLADLATPWYESLTRLPAEDIVYMRAAMRRSGKALKIGDRPRVRLSTIHSAKGGEADHVVLMTEMAWRTYEEMQTNPDDERRVWYVGVTRARDRLTLVNSETDRYCPWV